MSYTSFVCIEFRNHCEGKRCAITNQSHLKRAVQSQTNHKTYIRHVGVPNGLGPLSLPLCPLLLPFDFGLWLCPWLWIMPLALVLNFAFVPLGLDFGFAFDFEPWPLGLWHWTLDIAFDLEMVCISLTLNF